MAPFRTILVLCEGNHCRSPLAAALLRRALGPDISVVSAGLHALAGHPADLEVQALARELGAPLDDHRGQQLEPSLALGADLILVMDEDQKARTIARIPAVRGRVFLLGHWLEAGRQAIPDPFRKGAAFMRASAEHVQAAIQAWLPRLSS